MEYRRLGRSGLKVPASEPGHRHLRRRRRVLQGVGHDGRRRGARAFVDICLDAGRDHVRHGRHLFGRPAEEILGEAIKGRRDKVLISTKATFRIGDGPNDVGSSRHHLLRPSRRACAGSAPTTSTSIQLHGFDALTPIEEMLGTLDDLVRAGKIRYIGCSNFSGWHLMKSLAVSEQLRPRPLRRPPGLLLADRPRLRVGADAARPRPGRRRGGLEPARLGPAHRQNPPRPAAARGQPAARQAATSGRPCRRVPLSGWSMRSTRSPRKPARPSRRSRSTGCCSVRPCRLIVGARNEEQLRENLGAVGWTLTKGPDRQLDAASKVTLPYPYWHQRTTSPTAIRRRCSDGQLPDRSAPRALAKAVPTRFPVPEGLLPAQELSGSCRVAIHPAIS